MKSVCRRCDNFIEQKPYRVRTEEGGVVLLDMLVCGPCAQLARQLGLPVAKLRSPGTAADTATTGSELHPNAIALLG